MVARFPTSRTPTVMENMSVRLVQRFSHSLQSAELSLVVGASHLRELHRNVELSFNVLNVLERNFKMAPVSRRKEKTVTNNRPIDPLPFISLEIGVPTTDAEARHVYTVILSQLRSTFEVCRFTTGDLYRTKQP